MASSVQLSVIRARAQALADMENQNFVTTTNWNYWINACAMDLYDRLTQADPERYFSQNTFSILPPNTTQTLPADFYKLLRVDCLYGTGNPPLFYTLRKYSLLEADAYQFPVYVTLAGPAYRYRLQGNSIAFTPSPQASTSIRISYVPVMTQLVNDTDTLDGVNGWEEHVVLNVALRALQKEGTTDVQWIMAELAKWEEKIKALELERDSSFPEQTIDTQRGPWPFRGFSGEGGPI
jgi:hypothetical protein